MSDERHKRREAIKEPFPVPFPSFNDEKGGRGVGTCHRLSALGARITR